MYVSFESVAWKSRNQEESEIRTKNSQKPKIKSNVMKIVSENFWKVGHM